MKEGDCLESWTETLALGAQERGGKLCADVPGQAPGFRTSKNYSVQGGKDDSWKFCHQQSKSTQKDGEEVSSAASPMVTAITNCPL